MKESSPKDNFDVLNKPKIPTGLSLILLIAVFFVSSVSGSILLCSCSKEGENAEFDTKTAKDRYIKAKVEKKDMISRLNLIGRAMSEVEKSISFELDGKILFIAGKGDLIKEGEILAKLDDEMIKDEISDLELELKNAKDKYEHTLKEHHFTYAGIELKIKIAEEEYLKTTGSKLDQLFFDQKLLSVESEKEQADYSLMEEENNLNNIKTQYEDKKTLLDKIEITAPYDCLIVESSKSEGEVAARDVKILEIIGLDSMVVRIDIPEIDRTKVREGMSVNMSFDAYPGKIITGKIYDIAQISKTTKAGTFFEAFIEFVDLKDIDISNIYGLNTDVEIITEGKEDVLVVPNDFIYEENGEEFVYRMTGENNIEKIMVETGISDLNYTEVLSGLKEGDTVAITNR
ncbi:MAG: HlyD family efflux transporter periplasmic adaptor subunit [Actinomycetia bacterium]|nr:HlyD family efflux transporter periplasmic adaptor subunit [Actinomycetes bacterium]